MDEERRKFFFMIMFEDKEEIAIGSETYTSKLISYGVSSIYEDEIDSLKDYEFVRFSDHLPILKKKMLTLVESDVKINEQ